MFHNIIHRQKNNIMEKRYCKDNGFYVTSGRKFFQRRCKNTYYNLKFLSLEFFIGKMSLFVYLPY